jgi:hypothetical protein
MPMGETNRFKNYISEYLENSLDPTTHKAFEQALDNSAELKKMTRQIATLKSNLKELPYQTCSDDFSVKLRERIHTEPQPLISKKNVVRLSFAFSFVVIIAFALISLTNLFESTQPLAPIPTTSGFQNQRTNPPRNPVSGSNNAFRNESSFDVKTKSSQEVVQDSSKSMNPKQIDPRVKQVDQKK